MDDLTWLTAHLEQADPAAAAFACHALFRCGAGGLGSAYHARMAARLADPAKPSPDDETEHWQIAAWLWSAGEVLDRLDPDVHAAVLTSARRFLSGVELRQNPGSTLGCGALFGALRVFEPHLPGLELGRPLRALREFVFAHCTYQGRLADRPGGDQVDPGLLLLLPFGLFGPEDLLMVATVAELERVGVGPGAPTGWLAWYYKVKGTHPHRLAELRAGLVENSVWAAAFRVLLSAGTSVSLQHNPIGYDHPYKHYTPERVPRDPLAGETVELRCTAEGEPEGVTVEWRIDGVEQPPIMARYRGPEGGAEGYWHAAFGPFSGGASIEYRFTAQSAVTPWFGFSPLIPNEVVAAVGTCLLGEGGLAIACSASVRGTRVWLIAQPGPEETLRLRLAPGESVPAGDTGAADQRDPEPLSSINPDQPLPVGSFQLLIQPDPFRLTVLNPSGEVLLETHGAVFWRWLEGPDGPVQVECGLMAYPEERFYGTGERFDRLDRRGTRVLNTVYNQYKQQGDRTYIPVPFLLSSRGIGIWAATDYVGELDVGASVPDRIQLSFRGPTLDLVLIPGPAMTDVLSRFSALTARPAMVPPWAFGPWMSSNNWDSQAEVERQADLTIAHDIPSTVLVIEQWSDEATFCFFNDARYRPRSTPEPFRYEEFTFPEWGRWPDPKGMVDRLHSQGLKTFLWLVPVWKYMNGIRHEQRDLDEAFLIENGYVVKNADGSPYRIPEGWFPGSLLLDFTNPAAVKWWLDRRAYLWDEVGIDGIKTDGGESVWQRDLRFHDGTRGEQARNPYVNQYIGTTYQFVRERTRGEGFTFSRAGYTGAQAFPLHWAGDENSTWSALRASLTAGLNAGLSGIPLWGWDIAGFSGEIPTAELFCRATEMACFTPIMQYHAESKAQFNQDRTPWNIAERTGRPEPLTIYRRYAHLRMNLLPYLYSQADQACQTGLPMMRPLFLVHPDDSACRRIDDQFYLGDSLLVAPVLEEGANGRIVYLPDGNWYDFWTGQRFSGGTWPYLEAPLGQIPVFVRAGACLPLNLPESGRLCEGMRNADATGLRNLHLLLYPGEGEMETEHLLPTGERLMVQVRRSGSTLHVRTSGTPREVNVRSALPGYIIRYSM